MALQEMNRQKPLIKNRVEPQVEEAVVDFALAKPAYGQLRVSNELKKTGTFNSPGGVRSVWLRHDLETFQRRLKALEAKVAQNNLILTEEQLQQDLDTWMEDFELFRCKAHTVQKSNG